MPYGSDRSSYAWFFDTDFQRSSHCLSFTWFQNTALRAGTIAASHRGFTFEALAWTPTSSQLVRMHLTVSEPLHIVPFACISMLELPPLPTTKWRQAKCQSLIKITCLRQTPGLKLSLHGCSHVWCHHTYMLRVSRPWGFLYSGAITLKQVAHQSWRGQARRNACSTHWSLMPCACAVQQYFAGQPPTIQARRSPLQEEHSQLKPPVQGCRAACHFQRSWNR